MDLHRVRRTLLSALVAACAALAAAPTHAEVCGVTASENVPFLTTGGAAAAGEPMRATAESATAFGAELDTRSPRNCTERDVGAAPDRAAMPAASRPATEYTILARDQMSRLGRAGRDGLHLGTPPPSAILT